MASVSWIKSCTRLYVTKLPSLDFSRKFSAGWGSVYPINMAYTTFESQKSKSANKSPVIIMHGLFGSKKNWNTMSRIIEVKTDRKVFAADARNHGDSPHTEEMSYPHMAQDMVSLLLDLKLERANLLGHSMGGRTMMLVALLQPRVIERLIVVDISPVSLSPNFSLMPKYLEAMKALKFSNKLPLHENRKEAEEELLKTVTDPMVCQFLLSNLSQNEERECYWKLNLESISQNMENIQSFPLLPSDQFVFERPTLFICGANSNYVRHEDHRKIREYFPFAKFEYVPDAAHWVHSDNPKEFLNLVVKFLS